MSNSRGTGITVTQCQFGNVFESSQSFLILNGKDAFKHVFHLFDCLMANFLFPLQEKVLLDILINILHIHNVQAMK